MGIIAELFDFILNLCFDCAILAGDEDERETRAAKKRRLEEHEIASLRLLDERERTRRNQEDWVRQGRRRRALNEANAEKEGPGTEQASSEARPKR